MDPLLDLFWILMLVLFVMTSAVFITGSAWFLVHSLVEFIKEKGG